jgi:glucokinase
VGRSENRVIALAGDIGGTKTNIGLFERGARRPLLKALESYPSGTAAGLEEIIARFLKTHPARISCACFGVAGPVEKGRAITTNLPWEISESRVKKQFKWTRVCVVNDLAATAVAIPLLTGRETFGLNKGKTARKQNIGLVAPGTGLGMALLVWSGHRYVPVASEGGHADFGPNSPKESDLWRHLRRRFGHVSSERVLSGPGLCNVYGWLKDSGRFKEPQWLAERMNKTDPPRAIAEAALQKKSRLAAAALDTFVSVLGAVAGDLALTGTTRGGIYLGGGIAPKILPVLQSNGFLNAFLAKGRFRTFLEQIPVRVILNDKAALLGAASCAFENF